MKKIILTGLLLTSTLFSEGIFSAGNKNFGLTIGANTNFGNSYTVIGANINYFVVDNLSVGALYQAYLGGTPSINEITVPVTYYIPLEESIYYPYLGAFYNQTFIEAPFDDYSIYGGRAGVSLKTSPNSYVSFGWVQEVGSSDNNYNTQGYPEVSASFSF